MKKLILEYERKVYDLDNLLRHEKELFAKDRDDVSIRISIERYNSQRQILVQVIEDLRSLL